MGGLTPDEARSQAKTLLGAVETGADPIEERRAARAVRTFRELAEDFMRLHVATKRKTRTGQEYQRLLDLHVLPAVGGRLASILGARKWLGCMVQCPRRRAPPITPWRLSPPSGIGPRDVTRLPPPPIRPRGLIVIPNMGGELLLDQSTDSPGSAPPWLTGRNHRPTL